MNRLALFVFVPLLLLAAVGVARLVCRACDAVEQPGAPKAERRSGDEEFAEIVRTSLADLEREWRSE
jgi:hypothetical protein